MSLPSLQLGAGANVWGCIRKLEKVDQALGLMTTQGGTAQFLNNAENTKRLNGLVDDVREAVVDYQVRASRGLALDPSNICLRFPCSGISTLTQRNQW